MTGLQAWWDAGQRMRVGGHELFVWQAGPPNRRVVTLLHGYPGSSHDFAEVAEALVADGHWVVAHDLLGFGASDKPAEHAYSLVEQTDLLEALWDRLGVSSSVVVAHDYSVTIAQELLDRDAPVARLFLLNGGVFPQLHRPTPVQEILLDPVEGPELALQLNEEAVKAGLSQTFARPDDRVLDDLWRALSRENGHRLAHSLLHYVGERAEHGDRGWPPWRAPRSRSRSFGERRTR